MCTTDQRRVGRAFTRLGASERRWNRGEAVVSMMVVLVLVQMPREAMVMGSLMVVISSGRVGWYSPRS